MNPYTKFIEQTKARDAKIIAFRLLGWTMERCAAHFKISKQRVSQICKANRNGK